MTLPYGLPAVRRRAPRKVNGYSGETEDLNWAAAVDVDLGTCAFDPGGSVEPTLDGRASVVTQPSALFVNEHPDVRADDRLVIGEREWQVDGDPADYRNPWSNFGGLVVRLKAVEG